MTTFILEPGKLTLADIRHLMISEQPIALAEHAKACIDASAETVNHVVASYQTVYGINTGFGALANQRIEQQDLQSLQHKIILSHAAGTGELLSSTIVRLMMLLKINSLARGYSGIQQRTLDMLIQFYNAGVMPCIPAQGSVGASGDLAPLAHLACPLIGVGEVWYQHEKISAELALQRLGLQPLQLGPKEGLALLNGTQASTAISLHALFLAEELLIAALTTGAMSIDAARGSLAPYDARIHLVRGHTSQIKVAALICELLQGSKILASHQPCQKVQDPYSLRCQPQVMGACLNTLFHAAEVLTVEANAVSDNPLVFATEQEILSGGNFHAEPVAFVADALAIAIAEIGALAERRIALLIDAHFSGLPPFLVQHSGLNSGFMLAQVTAAALASENKMLAHPASVDSLPTSANQEDHVSMATHAGRRLLNMIENTTTIIGIELLAACQGIDFLRPLNSSPQLEKIHGVLRTLVPFYAEDRYFAPDIEQAKQFVAQGNLRSIIASDYLLN